METSRTCRIALVGSDAGIAAAILPILRAAGHACQPFADAATALGEIEHERFDLLLIAGDGADNAGATERRTAIATLLTGVRARLGYALPVIGVSAADDAAATVAALDEGMDHILVWPVAPVVLLAQVKAAVRRAGPAAAGVDAAVGHLVLRREGMRIHVDGTLVLVTAKEYALALLLCRNLGRALDRDKIFGAIWGDDMAPSTRTLDVHISRLRTKLLMQPDRGFRLSALYGRGYRLDYGAIAARGPAPAGRRLPAPRPAPPLAAYRVQAG